MQDEEFLIAPDGEDPSQAAEDRPAPRKGYPILYPLLALLVFAALTPLASLSWKLLGTNREALETSQQELQLLLVSSIAGRLDSHVEGLQQRMEAIASSFGAMVQAQGLESFERNLASKPMLGELLDENLIGLRLVTSEGRSYHAQVAGLAPSSEVEKTVTAAAASAFESGEGGGMVSDPCLLGDRAEPAVVISSPVMASGSVAAVLVGLVDISKVWRKIQDEQSTGHTTYALDRAGRLFAHTDPSLVARRTDLAGTEIVQRFLAGRGWSKETMLFTVPGADGRERSLVGSYEPTRFGWGIFVQVEENKAYAVVRKMKQDTRKWSLAALVASVVLAVAFARTLSRPVRRLTDAARRFAGGDFSARAEGRGRDEIGELAETFNRMAGDIENYIRRIQEAARENRDMFDGMIRALAEAIDAKDPYTRGHSARVHKFTMVIARHMGLDRRALRDIEVASLLHDVGKIGIDEAILRKPTNLTPDEFEIMKQHPDKGARIIARVKPLRNIIPAMRHHHEKFGGGGYPLGLKGEEIPLAARIIAVADILDAMISDRPYSRAMTFSAAVERVNEIAGAVTDPVVVEAFNRAYQAGAFAGEEQKLADKNVTATRNAALEAPAAQG